MNPVTSVAKAVAARHAEAQRHLAGRDAVMADLIARFGDCRLWLRPRPPFATLCRAIIGQQVSARAAATIEGRVLAALGCEDFAIAPILQAEAESLRAAGLSGAKVRYLRALAEAAPTLAFDQLHALDDDTVTRRLCAVPGIGPWTAEMFLIFVLQRPDVLSLGDVGLRNAINQLYAGGEKLGAAETRALGQRWAPWRSIASWYLWRLADGDTGTWQ